MRDLRNVQVIYEKGKEDIQTAIKALKEKFNVLKVISFLFKLCH